MEGRLLSMLETAPDLDLSLLNRATQAWVDREYHRTEHSEIKTTPLTRLKRETHVSRPDPGTAELARAFTVKVRRTQRLSDGTLTLAGTRYEVPSAYRHLRRLLLRHASWDRSRVFVADERTGKVLAPLFPVNRAANADRRRRKRAPVSGPSQAPDVLPEGEGLSPLMKKYLREYAATGLPPAYLPRHENDDERTRS